MWWLQTSWWKTLKWALSTFRSHPLLWRCYIDDTRTACTLPRPDPGLPCLSQQQPVQFTAEKESDESLAFLDVKFTRRENGTISTSLYRQEIHINQYSSFDSNHPLAHKVADALSSSGVDRAQEEQEIVAALKDNGYIPRQTEATSRWTIPKDLPNFIRHWRSFRRNQAGPRATGLPGVFHPWPPSAKCCRIPKTESWWRNRKEWSTQSAQRSSLDR